MIAVMMGVEDMGEDQPPFPQREKNRLRFGGVHRRAGATFLVAKKIYIVV
jgi:hypothetical protein